LLNNNQIQLQRPALYFSGAISYVDQNVLSNRGNLGTSANRFESGYSRNKNATVVSLELHLGDFRTRTLIPGMDSSNEVIIGNGGEGLDLAGRIGEYGWQFNVGKDYAQGSGAAVRTLVDLAVIELAGKWARVPYWQCLTMEQTHPNFQRQLRDWYDEGADGVHQGLIIQSLQSKGYLSSGASASALMLRRAISRFQADHGMVINGVVDFPTYERALRDFVALDSNGNLVRYGWRTSNAEPVAVVRDPDLAPPFKLKAYGEPAEKLQINIQIENVMNGRTQFEVGEQVFASVQVSRNSFLKCFLSNASGSVIQIFPNPLSRPHAQANQAIRLPDWMTPNPGYVIETTAAGTEGILCLATDEEVADKLPSLLKVPAFVKIVEVEGLADILQAYESALGSDQYASQILSWKVAPKASVTDLNSRNP
jgi:peptidoglycan hydrolase-like protein with peptidoglycan-binding domain